MHALIVVLIKVVKILAHVNNNVLCDWYHISFFFPAPNQPVEQD